MDVGKINLDGTDMVGRLTLTVNLRGMRAAMWRMRLGCWIVGMGIRITGMRGGVDIGDDEGKWPVPPKGYAGGGASPAMLHTAAPPPSRK